MKFSDLGGRKFREDKSASAAAKPAPAQAAAAEPQPAPLGAETEPPGSQPVAPPAQSPVPAATKPVPQPRTRKEQQRKAESLLAGKRRRPFGEVDAEAGEIYSRNLVMAGELLALIDGPYVEKYEKIIRLAELNSRSLGESPALLNYTFHATAGNYLRAHSANTAVISQAMGLAMALAPGDVSLLGFCAMAHDIGMTGWLELAGKEGRLTDEEFQEITLHAAAGAEKVDRIIDMDYKVKERAGEIISQVHERIDSSGYPRRLAGGEIDILAQIIGAADVYEAMSHPRPWRRAHHPHNAIKHFIDREGGTFNPGIVKALMETMTLYPPGSMVALSTGETARVTRTNRGALTRPVVQTLLDSGFEPVPPRTLDLMEYPLTAIEGIVEPEEISRRNGAFAAKLELACWWVD